MSTSSAQGIAAPLRFTQWGQRVLARLQPPAAVRLLQPDGAQSVWAGTRRLPSGQTSSARHVAVQLPDDLVLQRVLMLPPLADAHMRDALSLEARSASPFAADDLTWGYAVQPTGEPGRPRVHLALASRRQVAAFLAERWPDLVRTAPGPEVWALAGDQVPVVLEGFGESGRLQSTGQRRRWQLWLLVAALALASMAAITPTLQLRERAQEASQAYESVSARVAPLVRKRDELAAVGEKIRLLDAALADRADPAGVMEYLTQALPDDAYVFSLDVRGTRVTITGNTSDAAALLQRLSADPRLKDVRSPTAVTRQPGAAKETFTIEFILERPAAAPGANASTASTGSPAPAGIDPPGVHVPLGAPSGGAPVDGAAAPLAAAASATRPQAAPPPVASVAAPARPGSAASAAASPFVIGGTAR